MDKRFWMIMGVICLIFLGFLVFRGGDSKQTASVQTGTSHIIGNGSLKLVEYGDYQCPVCAEYAKVVNNVKQKYAGRLTFQYKNLPLVQIHNNALAASRAAEAADAQDKFWEMHDLQYQNQEGWKSDDNALRVFTTYAQQLGLDTAKFTSDFKSKKINDIINADVDEFERTKLELATPTFFLNGKQVKPTYTVESFSKIIDAELAKQ